MQLAWLEAGDVIIADAVVNQDGVSLTASKVVFVDGTLTMLSSGKVVTAGTSSFEMEARNESGQSFVAQVAITSETNVVRQGSGETVDADQITENASVIVIARQQSGTGL